MTKWLYPDGLVFRQGMEVAWSSRERGQRSGRILSTKQRKGETYLEVAVHGGGRTSVLLRAAICEPVDPAAYGGVPG